MTVIRHNAKMTTKVVPPLTLGWRLQRALDYAGISHAELMIKFEVSRQTVSRWCHDVGMPPKRFILEEIAGMCDVSDDWLIGGSGETGGTQNPLRLLGTESLPVPHRRPRRPRREGLPGDQTTTVNQSTGLLTLAKAS